MEGESMVRLKTWLPVLNEILPLRHLGMPQYHLGYKNSASHDASSKLVCLCAFTFRSAEWSLGITCIYLLYKSCKAIEMTEEQSYCTI